MVNIENIKKEVTDTPLLYTPSSDNKKNTSTQQKLRINNLMKYLALWFVKSSHPIKYRRNHGYPRAGAPRLFRKAIWILGLTIVASSFSLISSGAYGLFLYYQKGMAAEAYPAYTMLLSGLIYIAIGFALYKAGIKTIIKPGEAVLITVGVWILIPILDSVPFMQALHIPFIDALFESVSGWTTTGLTILSGEPSSWHSIFVPAVSNIPETLKLWRTLMQWEGGLGIVVLTIAILAPPGISAANLYLAEGKFEKLSASFRRSAYIMGLLYLVLTGISIVLFLAAGMPLGDSIQHAMTGIATAGFSTHTESLGYYMNRTPILIAGMIVMFLGAVNFADHYAILRGRFERLKHSVELHAQIIIIIIAVIIGYASWLIDPGFHATYTRFQVIFHIVSAFATGGFQAGDINAASEAYKILLTILCLVGGSAFSTAGGIKILRLLIAMKSIGFEADIINRPRGFKPSRKLGRYYISDELVRRTLATITVFIITYITLVLILAIFAPYYDIGNDFFEVASAMGNVGLSSGISAAIAPIIAKIDLILAMLLGRLEVMAYLVSIKYILTRI
jgi:trk system potassium uptake protein TrkH